MFSELSVDTVGKRHMPEKGEKTSKIAKKSGFFF